MPVIAINKTCTLMSRSRLESYKRLVSVSSWNLNVSSRLVKLTSQSRAFTSCAHPWLLLSNVFYCWQCTLCCDLDLWPCDLHLEYF